MDAASPSKRRRVDRVSAACDLCKQRKVKCDANLPCGYCTRKHRADTCHFSGPRQRGTGQAYSTSNTPAGTDGVEAGRVASERRRSDPSHQKRPRDDFGPRIGLTLSPTVSRDDHHEDTAVPLEARLLRDAQGKVIFIGDCAPLSFLQTVRHLIASEIDPDGIPVSASRDSILEISGIQKAGVVGGDPIPRIYSDEVDSLVDAYFVATSGLVDLFERESLTKDLKAWADGLRSQSDAVRPALYCLVAAIGLQELDESKAEALFNHAKDILQTHLCTSMNVATVQGYALIAIYMLRAFQPNGAYLYFSLAARTGYAIGLHRTEVNASFGASVQSLRDRIWKSLRVVDMFISNLLGRPPSTSDVDCTVKYSVSDFGATPSSILDASVQMFMIIERVVVEVYSRKRISLRIASYVSHQLKGWASNWLRPLTDATYRSAANQDLVIGACSTLCSYFYGIMLLTRPFLIYDLYEYLGASMRAPATRIENQEKRKFADAALDAAVAFVDMLQAVIDTNKLPKRMPLIVSWLFTASLVLAVGVLGRSGLVYEQNCKVAMQSLDYFASVDPHARQYSYIVQALLQTTTAHVRKREQDLRSQRKQASSQLFGLLPADTEEEREPNLNRRVSVDNAVHSTPQNQDATSVDAPSDWTMYDADFFALPWVNENDLGLQDFLQPGRHTLDGSLADIPLFPMQDHQWFSG